MVQRDVASVLEVEQAIARQVIHGGDLITNLLEVAPDSEPRLLDVLAEHLGMAAGPLGRLPEPHADVLVLVPIDVALSHGVFPLAFRDGGLWLATSQPLADSLTEGFGASVRVVPVSVPWIRIREGIAAFYGAPLDTRQLRLIRKLDEAKSPRGEAPRGWQPPLDVPSISPTIRLGSGFPPPSTRDLLATEPPPTQVQSEPPETTRIDPPEPEPIAPPPSAAQPPAEEVPASVDEGPSALPAALRQAEASLPASLRPSAPPPSEHERERIQVVPAASPPDETFVDSPPPPRVTDEKAFARLLRKLVVEQKVRERGTSRKRGPFGRSEAETDIDTAQTPDEVLSTVFAYGSQFFAYSALFVVHRDVAEGRDAFGPGATREAVLGIGVPLDLPGAFQEAVSRGVPIVRPMDRSELDAELLGDLDRKATMTGVAKVVLPLVLRNKAVALLLGDDGARGVELADLGDLVRFFARAGQTLERIALRKKRGGGGGGGKVPSVPPPKKKVPLGLASRALAQALSLPEPASEITETKAERAPTPMTATPVAAAPDKWDFDPEADVPTAHPPPDATPRGGAAATIRKPLKGSDRPPDVTVSPEAESVAPMPPPGPRDDERETRVQSPSSMGFPRVPVDADSLMELATATPPPPNLMPARPVSAGPPIPREEETDPHARHTDYTHEARQGEGRHRASLYGQYGPVLVRAMHGGLDEEEALGELAKEAEHSLAKIIAAFPGPLHVDRFRTREQLPPASECGPLLKLLVMLRRLALPFMTVRSTHPDVEQRFWATHVLGELCYAEAATAIQPRLFDDDVTVRRVARRAAMVLVQAGAPGEPLRKSLEDMIRSDDEPKHRKILALETIGDVRERALVPVLVEALKQGGELADVARRSLLLVTRHDLGFEPSAWSDWWDEHHGEHRVEWLIAALTSESGSLRRAAGEELKSITNEYFGYYDDLPPREREKAQQRYRDWWKEEGQFRFQSLV